MLFIIISASAAILAPLVYLIYSSIVYLYDAKNLRRFNNLSTFAGVTEAPWVWESIRGRRFKALHAAHQKWHIVRVAPNTISFNHPSAAITIYGHGSPATKSPFYDSGAGHFKNLADTRDTEEHSRKRRILATGYALTTLLRWEGKVASRVEALLDQYDSFSAPPEVVSAGKATIVEHRRWMDIFTIDIIHDIGLSANLRLIEKGHDVVDALSSRGETYQVPFRKSLWGNLRIHGCFAYSPRWYSTLKSLTWWDSRWKDSVAFNDIVTAQTKRRIDRYLAGEPLDDFFSSLMESKKGAPNMLTLGEMVAECSVMLNAGSETTGIALSNLVYLLVTHPKVMEKLREEVDQAFIDTPNSRVPSFEKVRYLPYLKACIDEGLRLLPPSATTTPRYTPPSGQEIMGHWIAGNTEVLCPTYSLQRNPDVFSNPDKYEPDRWLRDDVKGTQAAFIPFSAGARGCIGRNITYMEQQMLVASLVHRYNFQLAIPGYQPIYEEAVTCSPGSIPIHLSRRP